MQEYQVLIDNIAIDRDKLDFKARVLAELRNMYRSKAWLADQIGIHRQSLQYLLSQDAKKPKYVAEIAQALNVSVEFLLHGHESPSIHEKKLSLLPVFTTSDLASPDGDCVPVDQIPFYCHDSKQHFVLLLEEDSMAPLFTKGSYLIFKKDKAIKNGAYVLIATKDQEILFRRAFRDGFDFIYQATHAGLKPIRSVLQVFGVLVEARVTHF